MNLTLNISAGYPSFDLFVMQLCMCVLLLCCVMLMKKKQQRFQLSRHDWV